MSMEESRFHAVADALLHRLVDELEACDALDVDLQGGIATIETEDGGQYVINKHAPTRQLWLSSPSSGAWHFEYDPGADRWRSTRDAAVDFAELLAGELSRLTGRAITL